MASCGCHHQTMGRGKRRHSRISALVILGLEPTAGLDEIKTAHRELSKRFHPEAGGEHANAVLFREVQEAYDTLLARGEPAFQVPVSEGKIEPVKRIYARVRGKDGLQTVSIKRPGMPKQVIDGYAQTMPTPPLVDVRA